MQTREATDIVYIDIETGLGEKPPIEDFSPKANLVDPVKIQKDLEEKQEKAWRGQSLNSAQGKIFCIGVAVNDDPVEVIVGVNEAETMEMFDMFLHRLSSPKFVGHNILEFDGPWLFHKGLKYRQKGVVYHFQDKNRIIDTMRIMDGTGWKKMVSQDNTTRILQGKPGKDEISGAMVPQMILDGRGDEVISYCGDDVSTLRENYKILNSLGVY